MESSTTNWEQPIEQGDKQPPVDQISSENRDDASQNRLQRVAQRFIRSFGIAPNGAFFVLSKPDRRVQNQPCAEYRRDCDKPRPVDMAR